MPNKKTILGILGFYRTSLAPNIRLFFICEAILKGHDKSRDSIQIYYQRQRRFDLRDAKQQSLLHLSFHFCAQFRLFKIQSTL